MYIAIKKPGRVGIQTLPKHTWEKAKETMTKTGWKCLDEWEYKTLQLGTLTFVTLYNEYDNKE